VALLDKMLIIDKTGQIIATLPYHQDMDRHGNLLVAVKPGKDRFFIRYGSSYWIDEQERQHMPDYLEEMDAHGTLLNTYTLPPATRVNYPRTWQQYVSESLQTPAFFLGNLVYEKIGALFGSERLANELDEALGHMWGQTLDIAIRISVVSLLLGAIALVWARLAHFSWEQALAWTAFVLAFNIAGLITFRLVADWAVRVPCPQCGRKRPVEENVCPHCQATWPTPVTRGTEIFEHKEVVAAHP